MAGTTSPAGRALCAPSRPISNWTPCCPCLTRGAKPRWPKVAVIMPTEFPARPPLDSVGLVIYNGNGIGIIEVRRKSVTRGVLRGFGTALEELAFYAPASFAPTDARSPGRLFTVVGAPTGHWASFFGLRVLAAVFANEAGMLQKGKELSGYISCRTGEASDRPARVMAGENLRVAVCY